jgi:hypothetical protein
MHKGLRVIAPFLLYALLNNYLSWLQEWEGPVLFMVAANVFLVTVGAGQARASVAVVQFGPKRRLKNRQFGRQDD